MWGLCALSAGVSCTEIDTESEVLVRTYAVGVRQPNTISATDARIPSDEIVVGVSVGNTDRAYLIHAFEMPQDFHIKTALPSETQKLGRHVVNDLVDGVPITVTHCDDNCCSRVFTGDGNESLNLAVCGWRDGQMDLQLDGERFLQDAVDAPLEDYPFEITTWGSWKSDHPQTDIYIGTEG
jgi:hypothetical protein